MRQFFGTPCSPHQRVSLAFVWPTERETLCESFRSGPVMSDRSISIPTSKSIVTTSCYSLRLSDLA